MSVAELKSICDARDLKSVAMVDDIFDVPDVTKIVRTAYSAFRRDFEADEVLRAAVARVSLREVKPLPRLEDLSEPDIEPIWRALWKPGVGGYKLSDDHTARLRALFAAHPDGVLSMLDTVHKLLSLFIKDLGFKVSAHGFSHDVDAVSKADIVLVDFYLKLGQSAAQALETSSGVVKAIADAARAKGRAVPSFLLVSSRPADVQIDAFRKRAALMKSRFRFFPKDHLSANAVESLVNLHDLIDASDRAATVEAMIDDWKGGADKAADYVHRQMLELDIADLVYLDCFRLTHEGTTIGNYLRWVLSSYLHARVARELSPKVWKKADGLRLFSLLDENGRLDETSLTKAFDGPSDAIATAYGDIQFDETRGAANPFPAPLPANDLLEGDLFVKPKGRYGKQLSGASVRMVMTPSCDLMIRQGQARPDAETVLFVDGTLTPVSDSKMDQSIKDQEYVRLDDAGVSRVFAIDWKLKSPTSVSWEDMVATGAGPGYRRMGRIRDLYLHRIRDQFANTLTRVGVEIPPLFPRPKTGAVFISVTQNGSTKAEELTKFDKSEGLMWEIGPVSLVNAKGRKVETLLYQASRGLAAKIRAELETQAAAATPRGTAAKQSLEALADMDALMTLVRPLAAGVRGAKGQVEIKPLALPNAKVAAGPNLIIQPWHEAD